ncbi:MAG: PP2C family protein-serine/threonine phosphatase [Candidatus Eisenbacteria bacterium]|nr:PP2C family protein-serine/threonine phosphatase [Candidatus Eisenbacteria bacterium]
MDEPERLWSESPQGGSAAAGGPTRAELKALYRKLDRILGQIERSEDISAMLERILESLITGFKDELGFESGRLYKRDGEDFYLCCRYGTSKGAPIGFRLPRDYPAHERTLAEGLVIIRPGEPGFDKEIEDAIGVTSTFAAIAVGRGSAYVFAFSIRGEIKEENILYSLGAVRHVVNLKLEQQKLTGILEESREIQESLLPSGPPAFAGYDIDGRSRPTEIVGGDLFDYIRLGETLLGVAIGDASGHGLPAALMARDVVTGLRMGLHADLKVVRVIERLNEVIHQATLSSKFISLFYGELETNGTLIYCNAGHNPPLLRKGDSIVELDRGGLILGPRRGARYDRGYVQLDSGDTVALFTDGLVEHESPAGEPFGEERLQNLLYAHAEATARELVDAVFAAVDAHARGKPQKDDMTAVVIRRL